MLPFGQSWSLSAKSGRGWRVKKSATSKASSSRRLPPLAQRHVPPHERGGVAQSRHAGADVERAVAPQRWVEIGSVGSGHTLSLSFRAVAGRARLREDDLATGRVRGAIRLDAPKASALDVGAARHALGQPCHVGDDALHLGAAGWQRLAVHRPQEAVVDPLLEGADGATAAAVFREHAVDADPRRRVRRAAGPGGKRCSSVRCRRRPGHKAGFGSGPCDPVGWRQPADRPESHARPAD